MVNLPPSPIVVEARTIVPSAGHVSSGPDLFLQSLAPPSTGIYVDEHTSLSYSAVWACVRIIAGTVMSLNVQEYAVGEDGAMRPLPESPISILLARQANPEQPSKSFIEGMQARALLWGNAYAEIERNRLGDPIALWPLEPSRVVPSRDDRGVLYYDVYDDNGKRHRIEASDMLHVRGLSGDGIVGYSVIRMARESVSLGLAAEKFGASFFGNAARPSGVLIHPDRLGEEGMRRLKESWEAGHSGTARSGSVAVLQEGVQWQSLTIPPDDAQFLQTRQFQISDIGPRWFGVPMFMLGDMSQSRLNTEQMWTMFATTTIQQWVCRWEAEIESKLMPKDGRRRVRFDLRDLMRGDMATRAEYHKTMFGIGVESPNDIRSYEGLNPVDGGDSRFVPMNMVPLDLARRSAFLDTTRRPPPQRDAPPGDGDKDGVGTQSVPIDKRKLLLSIIDPEVASLVRRVVRKEMMASSKKAIKMSGQEFGGWRKEWLARHAEHVRRDMLTVAKAVSAVYDSIDCDKLAMEMAESHIATRHADTQAIVDLGGQYDWDACIEAEKDRIMSEISHAIEGVADDTQ